MIGERNFWQIELFANARDYFGGRNECPITEDVQAEPSSFCWYVFNGIQCCVGVRERAWESVIPLWSRRILKSRYLVWNFLWKVKESQIISRDQCRPPFGAKKANTQPFSISSWQQLQLRDKKKKKTVTWISFSFAPQTSISEKRSENNRHCRHKPWVWEYFSPASYASVIGLPLCKPEAPWSTLRAALPLRHARLTFQHFQKHRYKTSVTIIPLSWG